MYPSPALSAWQLAIMAIAAVAALAVWLTAVYLAARQPRGQEKAAAGSAPEAAVAGSGSRSPAVVSGREPERPPADRAAA